MYNLNINVATALPANLLGVDGVCTTPRTPEILNSLIAMTNPFDNYNAKMNNNTLSSSTDCDDSCSGSSPLASPTSSPPSVQHTCSQLIKEGLKLTIQTKRKQSGSDCREDVEEAEVKRTKRDDVGLTQEDEERRRRRRERNKIAATKCRLKKREKTVNLVTESEVLETQNVELKNQIQDLEAQRRRLMDMLSMHAPNCVKNNNNNNTSASTSAVSQNFEDDVNFTSDFNENNFVMNPYSKDPNFGKDLETDDISYTRLNSYNNNNVFSTASATITTNYYQPRNVLTANDCHNRNGEHDFRSQQLQPNFRPNVKKTNEQIRPNILRSTDKQKNDDENEIIRFRFDEEDCYKPNGIIETNYFGHKNEQYYNNEYNHRFNNNIGNGCVA